jgi:hypothetical protein
VLSRRQSSRSLSWPPTKLLGESSPKASSEPKARRTVPSWPRHARSPGAAAFGSRTWIQLSENRVPRSSDAIPSAFQRVPRRKRRRGSRKRSAASPEQSIPRSLGSLLRPPPCGGGGKCRPRDPKQAIP